MAKPNAVPVRLFDTAVRGKKRPPGDRDLSRLDE
jgi:hypothetical protein